eukprot:2169086-Rhodomonas_salina.2
MDHVSYRTRSRLVSDCRSQDHRSLVGLGHVSYSLVTFRFKFGAGIYRVVLGFTEIFAAKSKTRTTLLVQFAPGTPFSVFNSALFLCWEQHPFIARVTYIQGYIHPPTTCLNATYAISGTDIAQAVTYLRATDILRAFAMSGTDRACAATRYFNLLRGAVEEANSQLAEGTSLRVFYAMSGPEVGYAGYCICLCACYALSDTGPAVYAATYY